MVDRKTYVVYRQWSERLFRYTYYMIKNKNIYTEELLDDSIPILYTDSFVIASAITRRFRMGYQG